MEESADLNPVKCRFESDQRHQVSWSELMNTYSVYFCNKNNESFNAQNFRVDNGFVIFNIGTTSTHLFNLADVVSVVKVCSQEPEVKSVVSTPSDIQKSTFQFRKGAASVPAHRHKNPDGSVGGWVADTANVTDDSYISVDAKVFDRAQIHNSEIYDSAIVCGTSIVNGRSVIKGNSSVTGSALISNSIVRDSAVVTGSANLIDGSVAAGKALVLGKAYLVNKYVDGDTVITR